MGKTYKKSIFKKLLKDIGTEYTEDYINYAEDTIMVISLFHLAKSYYLMNEVGYLYSFDQKGNEYPKKNNLKCKVNNKLKDIDSFKFLKFINEYTKNNEKEIIMLYNEIIIVNYHYYFKEKKLRKKHYESIISVFDKILENNYLNDIQKNKIKQLKNNAIENSNKDISDTL